MTLVRYDSEELAYKAYMLTAVAHFENATSQRKVVVFASLTEHPITYAYYIKEAMRLYAIIRRVMAL